MENRGAEFPDQIWDCLAESSFDSLNEADKRLVLSHMSKDEYEEMRKSMMLLTDLSSRERSLGDGPSGRKSALMSRFDERHSKSQNALMQPRVKIQLQIWRSAAAVLLALSGFLLYERRQLSESPRISASMTDTPASIRETVVTKVIHDTFRMIVSAPSVDKKAFRKVVTAASALPSTRTARATTEVFNDVYIVAPTSLNDKINGVRGTRRRDDSLADRFATVSL